MTIKVLKYVLLGVVVFFAGYFLRKVDVFSFFEKKPEISIIDSPVKDFGNLQKGDTAIHYFKFKNSGNEDLKIDDIETRCGCTISNWNQSPIPPNTIDSIKVEYDTNIIGPFNRKITIHSNTGNEPELVSIKGIVKD